MSWFSRDTIGFLEALRANNARDWFEDNRKTYIETVREPAKRFADGLAQSLTDETGNPHRFRIFRINRDLRFSKDKTPYNTHIHLALAPSSNEAGPATWMIGLEPGKLTFGAGCMGFSSEQLDRWRAKVAGTEGRTFAGLLTALHKDGARMHDPELKRVPAPYDKDQPQAELLRRKSLTIWHDNANVELAFGPEGVANCFIGLMRFKPVVNWLDDHLSQA